MLETVTSIVVDAFSVLAGTNFAMGLFLAQVVQYLYGLINSMQIVVLPILFNLDMPDISE